MKRCLIILALLLGLIPAAVWAQRGGVAVSGKVVEQESGEPVEAATVQLLTLPDSTQAVGVATRSKGDFLLPRVAPGRYVLKVSYVGFTTLLHPLSLSASTTSKRVGTLRLSADGILLAESVVTAEEPPVVVKADTTEYAASAFRVSMGAMLEELIRKLPGVKVDDDGKITLNGEEIKKIKVNGKEFFGSNTEMSMKNLPADVVKKLKTYREKSDRERQTGIKDNEEVAVLDLILKKNSGWMGNSVAGYGSKQRYEGRASLSHFTDDINLSFVGSGDNTNGSDFMGMNASGQVVMSGTFGSMGQQTNQNAGFTYARKGGKLDLRGNFNYRHDQQKSDTESSSETFLGEESTFAHSKSESETDNHNLMGGLHVEWRPDSLNTWTVDGQFGGRTGRSWSTGLSSNRGNTPEEIINESTSGSRGDNRSHNLNASISYNHRFKKRGRNLYLSLSVGYDGNRQENLNHTDSHFFGQDSISDIERRTEGEGNSRNLGIAALYSEPLSKHYSLNLHYNYSRRYALLQSLVYDSINYAGRFNQDYNDDLSSRVESFYDYHNIGLSLQGNHQEEGKERKGLLYNLNLSIDPRITENKTTIGPNTHKDLPRQRVVNWSPSLWLNYSFSFREQLRFNYRGNSEVPDLWVKQEVIDVTDPMNLRYGNPNLKSAFTNFMSLTYNRYSPTTMRSLNCGLHFQNRLNAVADRMTYDKSTGARTYHKVNVNGNWNLSSHASFYAPLKNKKFNAGAGLGVSYSDQVGYVSVNRPTADAELSTTHNFTLNGEVGGTYRSEKLDASLGTSLRYNSVHNSLQPHSNRNTFDYVTRGNVNFRLPWDLELSTDANWVVREGYGGRSDEDELMWNAQISKQFLKRKQAMVRFKMYDILKQQRNQYRMVSETGVTDMRFNTLTSYCMLHVSYRFDTLGGRR